MTKFIAIYSKDQFFIYDGTTYKFTDGEFLTDSPELIEFLSNNSSCYVESLAEKPINKVKK